MSLEDQFSQSLDYHQLTSYARVMTHIHWDVIPVSGSYLFVKRLGPISFAKLQRAQYIDIAALIKLQRDLRIVQLFVEPSFGNLQADALLQAGFVQTTEHHAYSKTLICDISGSETNIFKSFSKTLFYKMRRSQRTGVVYIRVPFAVLSEKQKSDIVALHRNWSNEKKVSGYTDSFLHAMWQEMTHEGTMILAYKNDELVGAMFLYTHHHVGMYFYQFSSQVGRSKLFVPSGLAREAILVAKERQCTIFDLCSAYDERFPDEHKPWLGFTRHKLEFHPTPILYPNAFVRHFHL